ncbi:MAG: SDR family NAD(P)-dependent oxidoreductase [bacterium]
MKRKAILIGNSDGIGLATTRELLRRDFEVVGISRSESAVEAEHYRHHVMDVQAPEYSDRLKSILAEWGPVDLCVYCAGTGTLLDPAAMRREAEVFEVNLMGMVRTVSLVIPSMVRRGSGHFIGLSSVADELLSPEAPSYHASKAGFSNYLESLALALRPRGVYVTNVRFGFVDTKMAVGDRKPFMMSVDRAVEHLLKCIEKKPARYTAPWFATPLVRFRDFILRLGLK